MTSLKKQIIDLNLLKNIQYKININYDLILGYELRVSPFQANEKLKNQFIKWKYESFSPILKKETTDKYLNHENCMSYFNFSLFYFSYCKNFNEDIFIYGAKFNEFGFIVDDIQKDMMEFNSNELIESFSNINNKQFPISNIFWNLIKEVTENSHIDTINRFINCNYNWFKISNSPFDNFNLEMTFEEYHKVRSIDSAFDLVYSFFLIGTGKSISNEIYNSIEFKTIHYHFCASGFLTNDLFSFKNEKSTLELNNFIKLLIIQNCQSTTTTTTTQIEEENQYIIQSQIDKVIKLIEYHTNQFLVSIDIAIKKFNNDESLIIFCKNAKEFIENVFYCHINFSPYGGSKSINQ